MNTDFAKNLEPGDKVIVYSGGYSNVGCVREVTRLTKTQIILENNQRYRRRDGYLVGDSGPHYSRLHPYTEAGALMIRHYRLVQGVLNKATRGNFEKLSISQLTTIWEMFQ